MWIKRAKEYEKNINSGDPVSIAEVVRDLHKDQDSLEQQSYSERQIYLTALNRLSNEYAAVENIDKKIAKDKLEKLLRDLQTEVIDKLSITGEKFEFKNAKK